MMQIHIYAQQGNIAGVGYEIAKGVDIDCIDENEYSQQTPLMYAVSSTNAGIDMIHFLLEHGANVNAIAEQSDYTVLGLVVQSGNLEKIQLILDAGANIHYQTPQEYDVLIDAMHGRDILLDQNLLSILDLLISKGAAVNGMSSYGETAIKVAARIGRFDAVQLLLNAGANSDQLQWTELMQAVVFGRLEEVKLLLEQGADQDVYDCWYRTPWLLSIQAGELAKAKLLLATGANSSYEGNCGKTPLMYAIENNQPEILQWLIAEGFDIEATDDFSNTALLIAAECGATDCVKILLEAGVNPSRINDCNDNAIKIANNLEIVKMLVAASEDLNDINDDMRRVFTGITNSKFSLSQLSTQQYFAGKHSRFGTANPELMDISFWQAMICEGCAAYTAKNIFNDTENWQDPAWCYQRFGRTITQLPDGRIVEIAGEHEDYYDPDFCIYNDVVVYQGDGNFHIFGYPQDVFPPTDFHSATLVGEYIYIIGNLGYLGTRIYNETPVYRLHIHTFAIEKVETTGDKPGWISRHKAYYQEPDKIYITGGKLYVIGNDKSEDYIDNSVDYILDLISLNWSRAIV
ncbi:MAG: ankyrin repeat domain-containing protein (plasmid) [Dolichospermum sp. DET50]|nr:ankyrin repeat domain-containing protein [Dolichospermum sp. DET66]MBS3035920.1 ankyrin repeat domain-containing protein [Dolichospermum sp. DET67]MBS3041088.1 ankyrin repeat domain-containing protein [Dolichospermum sp. DET50]QSX71019.1 MAG: ankyrin repeat domain-containing protein [Dolichospermum sp. DET69]